MTGIVNDTANIDLLGGNAKGAYDVVVDDTTLDAADVNEIASGTTGTVNGTKLTALTGSLTDLATLVGNADVNLANNYGATIAANSAAEADKLYAIVNDTTGSVDAKLITKIVGNSTDLKNIQADPSFTHNTPADYAVDIVEAGNSTVANINSIKGNTDGVVTATASSTDAAVLKDLATNGSANDAITVTVTSGTVDAAHLIAIDGATSVTVTATDVSRIDGTGSEVRTVKDAAGLSLDTDFAAYVTDEDGEVYANAADVVAILHGLAGISVDLTGVTELRGNANDVHAAATSSQVTLDGDMVFTISGTQATVDQVNDLDALTSGVITAEILTTETSTELATLTNLGGNNLLTIVVADEATPVLASNIAKINAATDVSVDATAVSVVSGTEGDVHSVLMSASVGGVDFTLAGVDAVSARLSDSTSVTASKVKDLDGKTAGDVNITTATAIGGSAADIASVVGSSGVTFSATSLVATASAGSAEASDLTSIDAKLDSTVVATSVTEITGTAGELVTAVGAAGVSLANTVAVTVDSGTATVDQIRNTLDSADRVVTATVAEGTVSDLANLPDSSKNILTINVTEDGVASAVSATNLIALPNKTTLAIDLSSVSKITDTSAKLVELYADALTNYTGLGNETLAVTGNAVATDIKTLSVPVDYSGSTGTGTDGVGAIDLSGATDLTGSVADLTIVIDDTGVTGWTLNPVLKTSDATVSADSLDALMGKVTVAYGDDANAINATSVNKLTGAAAKVKAVLTDAGGVVSNLTNPTVEINDSTVDAQLLNDIAGLTSGAINVDSLTSVTGTASAVETALENVGQLSTLAGTPVTLDANNELATALNTLDTDSTAAVNASNLTGVTGLIDDVLTAYDANGSTITGLGDKAVTVTDDANILASKVKELDVDTSGKITAADVQTVTGSASDVSDVYDAEVTGDTLDGFGDEAVVLTGAHPPPPSDLLNIITTKNTGDIDADSLTTISGEAQDVIDIFNDEDNSIADDATGQFENLDNAAVTLTDTSLSASKLQELNLETDGVVNASTVSTITSSSISALDTLYAAGGAGQISGLGAEAITLNDTTGVSAAALKAIDDYNSGGTIDASSITQISGSASNMAAVYGSARISGLGDESGANNILVTDAGGTAAAADLNTIIAKIQATDASVDLVVDANITTITGTAADIRTLYTSLTDGEVTGLGGENITITGETTSSADDINYVVGKTTGTGDCDSEFDTFTGTLTQLQAFQTNKDARDIRDESLSTTRRCSTDGTLDAADLNALLGAGKILGSVDMTAASQGHWYRE